MKQDRKTKPTIFADIRALWEIFPPAKDPLALCLAIRARVEMNESDGRILGRNGLSARQYLQKVANIGSSATFDRKWSKVAEAGLLASQSRYAPHARLASDWSFIPATLRGDQPSPARVSANPHQGGLAGPHQRGLYVDTTKKTTKDSDQTSPGRADALLTPGKTFNGAKKHLNGHASPDPTLNGAQNGAARHAAATQVAATRNGVQPKKVRARARTQVAGATQKVAKASPYAKFEAKVHQAAARIDGGLDDFEHCRADGTEEPYASMTNDRLLDTVRRIGRRCARCLPRPWLSGTPWKATWRPCWW